jgi:outer membrane protein assembly factor BamE
MIPKYMKNATFTPVLLSALLLGACSSNYVPALVKPYRPDIQQGNVVIESTLAQLKPGMSQEQVKFILGSPLLVDPFHPNRWDYVFRYQTGEGVVETSRITINFKDNIYSDYSGKAMPDSKR